MTQATRKLSTSKHTQHVKFVQQTMLHQAVCWKSCSVTHSNKMFLLVQIQKWQKTDSLYIVTNDHNTSDWTKRHSNSR